MEKKEMIHMKENVGFVKSYLAKNNNIYWIFIVAFFLFLYFPTLKWMYGRFVAKDTYYSHGFLVPIVSFCLIWLKKNAIVNLSPSYSWWGGLLIVFALVVHLFSQIVYVFYLSGISMLIFIVGASLFIFGSIITKIVAFPIGYMAFMVPLPMNLLDVIGSPMKLFVAEKGAELASMLGILANQNGYYIETIQGTLLIDNPCSGLRSLIAMTAVGAIISNFLKTSPYRKIFLFLLTVPIALFINLLRVTLLIYVTSRYGTHLASPGGWVHDASGYVVFVFGGAALLAIGSALEWKK